MFLKHKKTGSWSLCHAVIVKLVKRKNLITEFPEKTKQLSAFIDALEIGDDRDKNRGFLIESLHEAQHIFGYLPRAVQQFVADKLKLHLAEVYGVISFYSYFTDKPVRQIQNQCMYRNRLFCERLRRGARRI